MKNVEYVIIMLKVSWILIFCKDFLFEVSVLIGKECEFRIRIGIFEWIFDDDN